MHPERFDVIEPNLKEGFAKAGPAGKSLADVRRRADGGRASSATTSTRAALPLKVSLALYIGGMGARDKNFYNEYIRRVGFEAEAEKIQTLFLAGKREEAIAAVPDALVDALHLVGTPERIRDRFQAWKSLPIGTLIVGTRRSRPCDCWPSWPRADPMDEGRRGDRSSGPSRAWCGRPPSGTATVRPSSTSTRCCPSRASRRGPSAPRGLSSPPASQRGDRVALWAPERLAVDRGRARGALGGAPPSSRSTRASRATRRRISSRRAAPRVLFTDDATFSAPTTSALLDATRRRAPRAGRPSSLIAGRTPTRALVVGRVPRRGGRVVRRRRRGARARRSSRATSATSCSPRARRASPRGAMCTHAQTLRAFRDWADIVGLRAGDRYLVALPFFHSFGYKAGWLACLMTGATTYPLAVFDVDAVLERDRARRASRCFPGRRRSTSRSSRAPTCATRQTCLAAPRRHRRRGHPRRARRAACGASSASRPCSPATGSPRPRASSRSAARATTRRPSRPPPGAPSRASTCASSTTTGDEVPARDAGRGRRLGLHA